ncbi:hypothetical protein C8R46DRAFT_914183, partial [Mycena filopes]
SHTKGSTVFPVPKAYEGEGLPSQGVRQWLADGSGVRGDSALAAEGIFKFSMLESSLAMGKDSVAGARAKIKRVSEETDGYESWSENLEVTA